MWKSVALIVGLCSAACAASVGTTGAVYVPKDAATTCGGYCQEIGLSLDAVVIMANNVGCVCGKTQGAPGSSAGGMAALLMQQEEEKRSSSSTVPAAPIPSR